MHWSSYTVGGLLELLAVMPRGKTPWARGDGLGLGVVVRSRVVLSKCIGQVTPWGLTGMG